MIQDIGIVGGGPAGAYLGYCLARSGIRAAIYDASHPREKPCGGGVTPFVRERFPLVRDVGGCRYVQKMLFISPQGKQAMVGGQTVMNVSRERLDAYLLERALDEGARLIEERVIGVQREGGSWVIRTARGDYRCGLLVGADGVNSVVRRAILGPIPRDNLAACVGCYAKGAERDYSVMRFLRDCRGYAWIFPRDTHSSIGIGTDIAHARKLAGYLNEFLGEYCPHVEILSRFGALMPAVRDARFFKLPCAGKDWIVIGDAAGHVDPVLGEGIRYALWGAHLAAEAIIAGDPSRFDRLWRKAYYPDLVAACRLADFIYDPARLELGVGLVSRSETFAGIITGLVAREDTYRRLPSRVFLSLPRIASEVRRGLPDA